MFTVYLAGPIENATKEQMSWWRDSIKDRLRYSDVRFLDPTRREPVHEQSRETITGNDRRNLYQRIVKQDLMDIDNSDLIFANIHSSGGRGTGTSMEIMYASLQRKPIIAWTDLEDQHHPFYEALITEKHYILDEAVEAIRSYL